MKIGDEISQCPEILGRAPHTVRCVGRVTVVEVPKRGPAIARCDVCGTDYGVRREKTADESERGISF